MLLLEHPAERPPIVGEHLSHALVAHVLALELAFQELVLLADLGLRPRVYAQFVASHLSATLHPPEPVD